MNPEHVLALTRAAGHDLSPDDAPLVAERLAQLVAFARELDDIEDGAPIAAVFVPAWEQTP